MGDGGKRWGKVVNMFLGEYRHTLDPKGRVNLPTKFRSALSHGVVTTRGVDRCLFVYPKEAWERLAASLARLPLTARAGRAFARLLLAGAMDSVPDGQGRVVLPEYLRSYARIRRRVVIAGVYDRLEIWDDAEWGTYTRRTERRSEAIAEAIGSIPAA